MKNINKLYSLAIAVLIGTSCTEDANFPQEQEMNNTLQIQASVNDYPEEAKAIVTGNALASGSNIGVTFLNSSDGYYDSKTYNNIKFNYNGSTWTGASSILLSPTVGKVYAYYPWVSGANIAAIAMTASTKVASNGTDYMYATPVSNITQTARTANLSMNHALSAVTITVKKGTYTGTGKVTAFTWKSATAGTSGTLNAKTGAITNTAGGNTAFDSGLTTSSYLTIGSGTSYQFMVVPTGSAGTVTFSLTMDGQTYSATTSSSMTFAKGNNYTFTLTLDAKQMSLGGVTVSGWTPQTGGSYVPSRT